MREMREAIDLLAQASDTASRKPAENIRSNLILYGIALLNLRFFTGFQGDIIWLNDEKLVHVLVHAGGWKVGE